MCFASAVSIINTMISFLTGFLHLCLSEKIHRYDLCIIKNGIGCKFLAKITIYNSGLSLFHIK